MRFMSPLRSCVLQTSRISAPRVFRVVGPALEEQLLPGISFCPNSKGVGQTSHTRGPGCATSRAGSEGEVEGDDNATYNGPLASAVTWMCFSFHRRGNQGTERDKGPHFHYWKR